MGNEIEQHGQHDGPGEPAESLLRQFYGRRVTVTNPDSPDASWRCTCDSVVRAPIAPQATASAMYCGLRWAASKAVRSA